MIVGYTYYDLTLLRRVWADKAPSGKYAFDIREHYYPPAQIKERRDER
jgi:hypothetical protein